jgi:hypothetical protein
MGLLRYSPLHGATRLYPHDSASPWHAGSCDEHGGSAERTPERAAASVGIGRW